MKRTSSISLFEHEQPSPKIWKAATRHVRSFDARASARFVSAAPFMWIAGPLDDDARAQVEPLLEALAALGARVHVTSRWVLDPEDYARADFVGILGTDLGDGFILNEDTALADGPPCPSCGVTDSILREPLRIDERRLDKPNADGAPPGPDGWDVVQLAGFFIGVSARFAAVLREHGVEGYALTPLLTKASRRPSARVFLLTTEKCVVETCPDHTMAEGGASSAGLFCPGCGRGQRGTLQGMCHVREDRVADHGVVSTHRTPGAAPHLRRSVDDAVIAANLCGIVRHSAFMLCHHGAPEARSARG